MKKEINIKINAILNIIKTVSGIIFPLITFPYISRVLQPENIGKINFATSFVSYFSLIASLGISTYAIRECSLVKNDKDKLNKLGSQILTINVYTTIFSYLLLLLCLLCFRKLDEYRYLIIIQSITISFTTFGCEWINSAMEDYKYLTIRSILFHILSLILMFIFVKKPEDYFNYLIITIIATSGACLSNIFYRSKYCNLKLVKKTSFKKHFKPIFLMFAMILAQNIFNSSDITMIGIFKNDYEVGLYSTAVKITALIAQIVASLLWVILPKLSIYFEEKNYEKINNMLKKIFNVLLTLGIPCAVGTFMLSEDIILVIAGSQYVAASFPLKVLMISFIFNLIGEFFLGNMVLLPSKNEKLFMILCCISTFINLILNLIFIPKYGMNAAALTTMFSTFLLMIMLLLTKDKKIKFDYLKEIIAAPILGSIIIIIICLFFKLINDLYIRVFISIIISFIVYFAFMLFLKNDLIYEMVVNIRKSFRTKRL